MAMFSKSAVFVVLLAKYIAMYIYLLLLLIRCLLNILLFLICWCTRRNLNFYLYILESPIKFDIACESPDSLALVSLELASSMQ